MAVQPAGDQDIQRRGVSAIEKRLTAQGDSEN